MHGGNNNSSYNDASYNNYQGNANTSKSLLHDNIRDNGAYLILLILGNGTSLTNYKITYWKKF